MRLAFLTVLLLAGSVTSCRMNLSFTGVNTDARTATVKFFTPVASLAKPTVGQVFTEALKDAVSGQGKLDLVNSGADLVYEGTISGYSTAPVAIQGNDQAAMNRLTITVQLKFTDIKNNSKSFESAFTRYADFSAGQSLAAVEDQLIRDITEQLVQDIINKTLQDW
ncbi:MAG: LptE family protein [Bacteroidia bacterium]|nr:LptE family protein [Bacteroidia bacterium]